MHKIFLKIEFQLVFISFPDSLGWFVECGMLHFSLLLLKMFK